jgi:tRNA A-37 threonylcarbamoyl transferase component Bud32
MEDILGRKVGVYRIPEVMKEFISMKITGIRSRLSIMSRKVLSMIDAELACIGRVTGTLEDPKKYLYLRTRLGLVKLSEKASMEGIVERVFGPVSRIEAKKVIGTDIIGIFNTLYEVSFSQNSKEKKVVVKKFDDWASFKWFPAALYTLGVQDFAVLGRERLAKEYIFNRMLRERGFHVPDILYASWEDKLLLEEFIEGETLGEIVQRIATRGHASQEDLNIAKKIGKLIAQVHNEGIVLGDCKPDNVIVTGDGRLYFVDLEQARRGGNPAWDLVEFLCFSARYIAPLLHTEGLVKFLKNFLQGYLMGGGAKDTIKEASQAKYLRLFAFLILPTTLLKIRRVCREVLRETL